METDADFAEGRALVGKEDSIVFLLGVLNLGAVFLYSVFNQLTRPQRYFGGPNSFLSNEYIERKVQSILDELVLHMQTSTYYKKVIDRESQQNSYQKVPKTELSARESGYFDGSNFLRRTGLPNIGSKSSTRLEISTRILDGKTPKRLRIVRRQRKSQRSHRAVKLKLPPGLKIAFAQPNVTTDSPKPVRLKHYYHPVASGARIDNSVEELMFVDTVKKSDKMTVHAPVKSPVKQAKTEVTKPLELTTEKPKKTIPETQTRPSETIIPSTQSTTVGLVHRLTNMVEVTAPLATSVLNIFGKEFYAESCLEKKLCEINQSWRSKGVVTGTLSPLISVVMSWAMKGRGWPPLADTVTAIRSGWVGQPCQLLYGYCQEEDQKEGLKDVPPPAANLPPPLPQAAPLPVRASSLSRFAQYQPTADPKSHLVAYQRHTASQGNIQREPYLPQKVLSPEDRYDLNQDDYSEEDTAETSNEEYQRADVFDSEEAVEAVEESDDHDHLRPQPLTREFNGSQNRFQSESGKPESQMLPLQDFILQQQTRPIQPLKRQEVSFRPPPKQETTSLKPTESTTTTTPYTTTESTTTTVTTPTTTTNTVPPGRPRSNVASRNPEGESNTSYYLPEIQEIADTVAEPTSDFSTVAGVQLQDQYVQSSPLKQQMSLDELAYWKPDSNSFFDISEGRPGLYYSRGRWERGRRNSKLLRDNF